MKKIILLITFIIPITISATGLPIVDLELYGGGESTEIKDGDSSKGAVIGGKLTAGIGLNYGVDLRHNFDRKSTTGAAVFGFGFPMVDIYGLAFKDLKNNNKKKSYGVGGGVSINLLLLNPYVEYRKDISDSTIEEHMVSIGLSFNLF